MEKESKNENIPTKICALLVTALLIVVLIIALVAIVLLLGTSISLSTQQNSQMTNEDISRRSVDGDNDNNNTIDDLIMQIFSSTPEDINIKKNSSSTPEDVDYKKNSKQELDNESIYQDMLNQMESKKIKESAFYYAEYPHEPGSKRNEKLGRETAKKWKDEFGLDKVEIFKYNVLLSFPERPAEIYLNENSRVTKKIEIINEPSFGPTKKYKNTVYPFNAFSRPGNITGEVVYCNYGRDKDYSLLLKLNVVLDKKIFIIRYGLPSSRGTLMDRAMDYGAVAVLFYSDPIDYTYAGQEYPEGWMLNEYGIQRGNIGNTADFSGDLLSQGYPSKDNYFREKISKVEKFQYRIPSQPLSASLAEQLLNFMDDYSIPFPKTFRGNVNSTYALQTSKNKSITLSIDNKLEDGSSLVICGTLLGSTEPDRYIMIGNHRDAWTYGSADPVSGTAVMSEVVRVLGKYRINSGFRPRRSIMACSWGAEEVGMIGSEEWAEENIPFLTQKVIAYLNVDMAVEGNYTLQIKSSDHMAKSIFEAAKRIESPDNSSINLFQEICIKQAALKNLTKDLDQPEYHPIGTESDSMIFVQRYGMGVSDYRYIYNGLDFPMLATHNGQYHTLYDNYDWMSRFVDPTFKYHLTLGKLWLMHALLLADSAIIPLDIKTYAEQLQKSFFELEKEYDSFLKQHNVSTKFARKSIADLVAQANIFSKTIDDISIKELSFFHLRAINDVIMKFGQQFMLGRENGATTLKQVYGTYSRFQGIVSAITKDHSTDWDLVRIEITNVVWCVDMATRSLDLSELRLQAVA